MFKNTILCKVTFFNTIISIVVTKHDNIAFDINKFPVWHSKYKENSGNTRTQYCMNNKEACKNILLLCYNSQKYKTKNVQPVCSEA